MTQEHLEHGNVTQEEPIEHGNLTPAPSPPWLSGPTRRVVIGLGVVAVVGVVALLVGLGAGPKQEAEDSQTAAVATAPSRPPTAMGGAVAQVGNATPASLDAHAKAGELRREATKLCRDAKWDKCMANFDEAARLDPIGDNIIPIQRWRAAAASAKK
jgi:hypothetical protein